ncbi:cytochrome c peroxidase [soil metagenome]
MRKTGIIFSIITLLLVGFKSIDLLFSVPHGFPVPVYDFENKPLAQNKIDLGRALFYDPVLSRDSTISCASCHSPYNAFSHIDHALSHGIDNSIGTRNAPALMNLAWQKSFMWDGAINHLDVQPLAPITNAKEMDETILQIVKKLNRSILYKSLFKNAFGDTSITGERVLLSIAQFQLTLVSAGSKYDSVVAGKSSFTSQEKNGYSLFKKNCNSCHTEPLFSTYEFRNNGLSVDTTLNDYGKWNITHKQEDSLLFKIPTLRNVEFSYPYMHDGRFKNLNSVLKHYTEGIVNSPTLAKELQKPIILNADQKVDLIAFLLTLTDKKFIFNPAFAFPREILLPKPKGN